MNSGLYEEVGRLSRKWRKYPNIVNKADPENKNILLEKNARLAVNVALKYRGLGLDDDELISAAFEGLAVSYDKYDGTRSVTREKMLTEITEDTTSQDFLRIVEKHLPYSNPDNLFAKCFPQTPSEMREWVNGNVKPAKFPSVAYFWCKAMVLSELERYGRPLRVAENYRVDNQFVSIDDNDVYFSDKITDTSTDTEEVEENYKKLFEGVPANCERMLNLRWGIGCDQPLTLREIGEIYGRTVGEVKAILSAVEDRLKDNIRRYKLNIGDLLPAL